jgi:hypothetical protein
MRKRAEGALAGHGRDHEHHRMGRGVIRRRHGPEAIPADVVEIEKNDGTSVQRVERPRLGFTELLLPPRALSGGRSAFSRMVSLVPYAAALILGDMLRVLGICGSHLVVAGYLVVGAATLVIPFIHSMPRGCSRKRSAGSAAGWSSPF